MKLFDRHTRSLNRGYKYTELRLSVFPSAAIQFSRYSRFKIVRNKSQMQIIVRRTSDESAEEEMKGRGRAGKGKDGHDERRNQWSFSAGTPDRWWARGRCGIIFPWLARGRSLLSPSTFFCFLSSSRPPHRRSPLSLIVPGSMPRSGIVKGGCAI